MQGVAAKGVKEKKPQKEIFTDMPCLSKHAMDHFYLLRCQTGEKEVQERNNEPGSMF